jgi:pimeloyl-ACP methyl ester carboxylesterase
MPRRHAELSAELYPFEAHYLDRDGLRYHYVDEGPRETKRAIVMLHGNPSWSFYYRELIRALSPQRRAIAPDHIGCGRSDKPDDRRYHYTLASRVDDLNRLVEHLGLEQITLVVHDWGGMIGMAWATQHPQRVERLVVMNTAAFPLPRTKSFPPALALARLPLVGAVLVRGFNAFSRGATRYCVTRRALSPAVARGYLAPYDSWQARIAVHRFVQDIPLHPSDTAYPVLTETAERLQLLRDKPMLLCWGLRDFVFDQHFLAEWERRFPQAQVQRFDDAGHYVLEDATAEIVSAVEQFIRD